MRMLKTKPSAEQLQYIKFDDQDTAAAINNLKMSKAMGPDGISTIMIKHLGNRGIRYLSSLINLSLKQSTIPDIWKTARIILLPKPNKPTNKSGSYRPISRMSPVVKLLESRKTLKWRRKNKCYSTTTALHLIHDQMSRGLNKLKNPAIIPSWLH